MNSKPKNLWSIALMSFVILTLLTTAACGKGKVDRGEEEEGVDVKNAKVHEWKKIPKAADFIASDNVGIVKSSRDGKFVYFAHDGTTVRVFDVTDAGKFEVTIADTKKFSDVALQTSSANDNTPGKAQVNGATVYGISPTRTGALLHVKKTGANGATGIVYVHGKTQTNIGWVNDAATGLHFSQVTTAADDAIHAYTIEGAADTEMVYICGKANNAGKCATELRGAVNLASSTTQKLAKILNNNTQEWSSTPILVSTGADAYVVTKEGIQKIAEAGLGTQMSLPQRQGIDPKHGSDLWKTGSATGSANLPAHAIYANGNVYIGFSSTGATDGGVNILDVAGDTIAGFTDDAWKGVSVLGFAVHGNHVWAVTKTGLVAVQANGKKGASLVTKAEAVDYATAEENALYDKGVAIPTDHITGALFVGDNLIITTSDQGVLYRLAAKPRRYTKKS